jgi:phosphoglycolate phosphatase
MGFSLCIFDLDGTLVDTSGDLTNSVNDMLSHYHIEKMKKEKVVEYVGDGIKRLVERCISGHAVDVEEAVKLFKAFYAERLVQTTHPYPGVPETLKRLDGKVKTVLTNKAYQFTKEILSRLDLSRYFAIIVGGDTFQRKKPSTDAVDFILRETGVERKNTVLIGDGKNDMLTAHNAGIASIYVTYGFGTLDGLGDVRPDYVIDSPEELLRIC